MKELSSKDFRILNPGTQKRVPGLAGVDEFYYGLTHEGQENFVFRGKFQHSREIASTQLLDINLSSGSEDFSQLNITLQDKHFLSIFIKLIYIIVESVEKFEPEDSDQDRLFAVLTVINDWKELFQKAKNKKLSDNRIVGLLGELIFLQNIVEKSDGKEFEIDCWQGPEGNDEDFSYEGCLFEIKSSKSTQNNLVRINSLRQINSEKIPAYLVHKSMSAVSEDDQSAISLYTVVEKLKHLLGSDFSQLMKFDHKLLLSGYIHDEKYTTPSFRLDSRTFYEIRSDFPLIYSEDLDARISRVRYSIDLDKCREFIVNDVIEGRE